MKNIFRLLSTVSVLALATTVFATPAYASSPVSAVRLDVIDPVTKLNAEIITVTVVAPTNVKKITLSFDGASWDPPVPFGGPEIINLSNTEFETCSKYTKVAIKISGTPQSDEVCNVSKPGPSIASLERDDINAVTNSWGTVTFQIAAEALQFGDAPYVLTVESFDGNALGIVGTLTFTTVGSTDGGTDNGSDNGNGNQGQQVQSELAKTGGSEAFIAPLALAALLMIAGASTMALRRRRA